MPKYICVYENDCSDECDTLERAFRELNDDCDAPLDECIFYEVKEVKVEMKLIAVPTIVKEGA